MKSRLHSRSWGMLSLVWVTIGCTHSTSNEDPLGTSLHAVVVSSSACEVEYVIGSQWNNGFGASVKVTNKGAAINGWEVGWLYSDGQQISSLWNGQVSQTAGQVLVSDVGWNSNLSTGSSVSFGFNGSFLGNNSTPMEFTLNGVSCGTLGQTTPPEDPVETPEEPIDPPEEPVDDPPEDPPGDVPEEPVDVPEEPVDTPPAPPTSTCSEAAFNAASTYGAGDRVASAARIYECRPFPFSGWCSLAGYEPGYGNYGQDAWLAVDDCTGGSDAPADPGEEPGGTGGSPGTDPGDSDSSDPDPDPGSGGTSGTPSECNAPAWQAGTQYQVGDIVAYQGALYVAENANPGYDPVISTWFWYPYSGSCTTDNSGGSGNEPGGNDGGTSGGTSDSPFADIISEADFNALFPGRNTFYTYEGLLEAASRYPAFAGTGDLDTRKREAAAFLANVTHETGDLVYVEEINKGEYCDNAPWFCPCEPGKRYFGRGPIQLSWNYNYCAASADIFGDREVLRRSPERVSQESWLAWSTALWFWMTQTGAGTMTAHDAMVNNRGFGETIRTINGGLECGGASPSKVQLRIGYYQEITSLIGVSPGSNLGC